MVLGQYPPGQTLRRTKPSRGQNPPRQKKPTKSPYRNPPNKISLPISPHPSPLTPPHQYPPLPKPPGQAPQPNTPPQKKTLPDKTPWTNPPPRTKPHKKTRTKPSRTKPPGQNPPGQSPPGQTPPPDKTPRTKTPDKILPAKIPPAKPPPPCHTPAKNVNNGRAPHYRRAPRGDCCSGGRSLRSLSAEFWARNH